MSARDALFDALVAGVPAVAGRVFESFAAPQPLSDEADLPFLVVEVGGEQVDGTWQVSTNTVDVFAFVERTAFATVDGIMASVNAALNNRRFVDASTMVVVEHEGASGPDMVEDDYRALVRGIRFRVYNVSTWLAATTYSPDIVAAMNAWTVGIYPDLGTNPATWAPSNTTPAVYWRMHQIRRVDPYPWGAQYTLALRAHVIVPGQEARRSWVRRLAMRLPQSRLVVVSNGAWFRFTDVSADVEADAFATGQIEVVGYIRQTTEDILASDDGVGGFTAPVAIPAITNMYVTAKTTGYPTPTDALVPIYQPAASEGNGATLGVL